MSNPYAASLNPFRINDRVRAGGSLATVVVVCDTALVGIVFDNEARLVEGRPQISYVLTCQCRKEQQ